MTVLYHVQPDITAAQKKEKKVVTFSETDIWEAINS